MLSLRVLTRAAPRTASRIATTSSSIRPAFQNALRSRIAVPTPRIATFSTTRARFDEHSQQLAAKLEQEISLESVESEQQAGSDSNVEQFKAGKDKAFNALVGQVMKASQGKANPAQVNELLRARLAG